MATIRFTGFVTPGGVVPGSTGEFTPVDESVEGLVIRFKIDPSVVSIDCEVPAVDVIAFNLIHMYAFYTVRGILDAVSFTRGLPLTLILTTCTHPNGETLPLRIEEEELARLCTVSHTEVIKLSKHERAILKHLHDLSCALINPLETEANCAKAVEGFAQLLLPGAKEVLRWQSMREKLNLTEEYLKFITGLSKGQRHGTTDTQSLADIVEMRRRSWTVANRFLEFRKRGNINLSQSEFPVL